MEEVFTSPGNNFIFRVAVYCFGAQGEEETFSGVVGKAVSRNAAPSHIGGGPLV